MVKLKSLLAFLDFHNPFLPVGIRRNFDGMHNLVLGLPSVTRIGGEVWGEIKLASRESRNKIRREEDFFCFG